MILACSGEGYWNDLSPTTSGSSSPPVSPKLWNAGSGLNQTQSGSRVMWAATWATFESRLAWLSTTPLGAPKLPEVNSTTPMSSGAALAANRRGKAAAMAA